MSDTKTEIETKGKTNEGFSDSTEEISVAVDVQEDDDPDSDYTQPQEQEDATVPVQNGPAKAADKDDKDASAGARAASRKSSIEDRGSGTGRTVIHVADAQKAYGTGSKARNVLQGLSMSVQEHTIYGLLGASGCGKTTLLSCIVALRKLDSGTILVCGQPTGTPESGIPGKRVGYMPQEIALNGECNIQEVLLYFGRIYGMSRSEIDNRHSYLVELLSLEGLGQSIENLSQGQQRRVSMAVALLHEPEILVLDEPTVGCDPLLRDSIWKYLHDLVAQKTTTVVVTTHYIEEMRQADRIGIMRSGHLLCEDSPSNLLQTYNENLLDTVVVKLCQQDAKEAGDTDEAEGSRARARRMSTAPPPHKARNARGDVPLESVSNGVARDSDKTGSAGVQEVQSEWRKNKAQKSTTSMVHRLHGLIAKNVLVVLRNLLFTICLICVPAATVLVFCVAVGSDPSGLKIGVVNEDSATCLTNYTQRLSGNAGGGCLEALDLSCEYLFALDGDSIDLVVMDTVEEAIEKTANAELWGFVVFGSEFSKNFYKRMVEGDTSSNETINGSQINIRLDMTGASNGLILQKKFIDGFRKLTGQLLISCEVDPSGKDLPIAFGEPVLGTADAELSEYTGLGIGLGFTFFMCALQCGLTYIVEKKDGMLNRTLVAGVSRIDIMLSHFIVQLVTVALIQILVTFLIIYIVIDIPLRGSIMLCFFLLVVNCMAGMSLGFLLATFCSDEKYAMLLAMGTVFPNFLIAGLIWTIEGLPKVLQGFSLVLPCTLTGEAFRSISLRGYDITHPNVYVGFISAAVWMTLYWIVIILWHRFGQRKQ